MSKRDTEALRALIRKRGGLMPPRPSHFYKLAGLEPFTLTLVIQTVNPLNRREHWAKRAERVKEERNVTSLHLLAKRHELPDLPATVRLTRFGPRVMDDDGLSASFKAIRDGIQDAYGVDDGSELFHWKYRQADSRSYYIRIEIVRRKAVSPC